MSTQSCTSGVHHEERLPLSALRPSPSLLGDASSPGVPQGGTLSRRTDTPQSFERYSRFSTHDHVSADCHWGPEEGGSRGGSRSSGVIGSRRWVRGRSTSFAGAHTRWSEYRNDYLDGQNGASPHHQRSGWLGGTISSEG